jgi:hypothetical protein
MSAITPTKNTGLIVDEFINYATDHLRTVSGVVSTTSLYPPAGTPNPGFVNWSGYFVPPTTPSVQASNPDLSDEAAAVKRDIEVEYPITKRIFEDEVPEPDWLTHNKDVDFQIALLKATAWNADNEEKGFKGGGSSGGSRGGGGGSKTTGLDNKMYNGPGEKLWPAIGPGPAPNFEVSYVDEKKREWYVQNPEYITKCISRVTVPLNGTMNALGGKKNPLSEQSIQVHKDLAAIVEPIFAKIKAKGMQKYIENCGGGLAVRQVTNGIRLSNHAWGTAIDLNSIRYPWGTDWYGDTIVTPIGKGITSTRTLTDFDKGFLEVIQMFRDAGMLWLARTDPMHISIYETS